MVMNKIDNNFRSNRHITYSCKYHVIFCSKYRRSVLVDGVDKRLKSIIKDVIFETRSNLIELEIMPDHVHLLIDSNPKIGIYNQINKIKGFTSHELRKEFPSLKKRLPCLWTRSKFISTVGSVSLEVVKKYIENQKNV